MQGSRPLPHFGGAAAGSGTWAVAVPSSKGAQARALLRESGEAGGIVSGEADSSITQVSSLKFVLFSPVVPMTVIATSSWLGTSQAIRAADRRPATSWEAARNALAFPFADREG